MSHRVASSQLFSAHVVSLWGGLGIPGAQIPTTGDNDGSPLADDDILADAEYRLVVITPPSAGTLVFYPDTSFEFSGAPDNSYTFTYQAWENSISYGSSTEPWAVGVVNATAPGGTGTSTGSGSGGTATGVTAGSGNAPGGTGTSTGSGSGGAASGVVAGSAPGGTGTSIGSGSGGAATGLAGGDASAEGGTGVSAGSGSGGGATGEGAFSGSLSDADITRICDAMMLRLLAATIPVNATQIIGKPILGDGVIEEFYV